MLQRLQPSHALCAALSLAAGALCVDAKADVVYSSLPASTSPNPPSYGYEANQLSEVGDYVTLAGTARNLQSVTVTMSDFALAANYPTLNPNGFSQALTLNLYAAPTAGIAGALLATDTITTIVPFRPPEDPTCPFSSGAYGYRGGNGACQNGVGFNVTFDFSALGVLLPDSLVFGLAYNTQDYGAMPTHVAGPYNSLNFAAPVTGATIGTDVDPDSTFFRIANGDFASEGGNAPYVVAAQIVAVPEPSSFALMGLALASMFGVSRRKRRSSNR